MIFRKYFLEELYEDKVTVSVFYNGIARIVDWSDRNIVDRTGNLIGMFARNSGRIFTTLETGQVQVYGAGMSLGIITILFAFLLWG